MLSLLRVIKFAFQDIYRNFSLSIMTVLILVLMLLSINTLVIINVLTGEAVSSVKDQIDVGIYFNHEANNEEIEEIRSYISSFPEVVEITFLDKDQVLSSFREQYEDNEEITAALEELGENPLGPTMIVKTREPREYEKVITALDVPEYENVIEAKTFADTEKAIERIHTITTQVERFSLVLSSLFAVIAFLIIFNTIRVAIYTHRIEINIKKLVGATNWFVRGPYIIESLIFSLFSMLITLAVVWISLDLLNPYITIVFQEPGLLTNYYLSNLTVLLGGQLVGVVLLTVLSSLLAMRKYLRV